MRRGHMSTSRARECKEETDALLLKEVPFLPCFQLWEGQRARCRAFNRVNIVDRHRWFIRTQFAGAVGETSDQAGHAEMAESRPQSR